MRRRRPERAAAIYVGGAMTEETYVRDGEYLVCVFCRARTLQPSCFHKKDCGSVSALAFLTPRQREVGLMVGWGKPNLEIAETLGLTLKTVEVHRHNVFRRLGVHSAAQLVHRLYQLGVFEPEQKAEMPEELKVARPLQPDPTGGRKFGGVH